MIHSTDIPSFKTLWFNAATYQRLQTQAIEERLASFDSGRLYLEIGGKFLFDPHAARVLPGFDPHAKKEIFAGLLDQAEILFCVDAQDMQGNRQLGDKNVPYADYVLAMVDEIEKTLDIQPHVVINKMDPYALSDEILSFQRSLQRKQYRVRERYLIDWYPDDLSLVLSEDWFGQDDHIPLMKNLVLVVGAASNSGKMSTCLGQIYQDTLIGLDSGYAKFETFPIWNLPLDHPVNLAYEAATADIGDYNLMDQYHMDAYGVESVNYNRDISAFQLILDMSEHVVSPTNKLRTYQSPTDMCVNTAGSAITDDKVVCQAAMEEIIRRKQRYTDMKDISAAKKCDTLLQKAKEYCSAKGY